jgi:putative transposase
MPPPQPRPAGTMWEITRRTERRVFLFRPDAQMDHVFLYALGVAAQRTGVVIISAVLMSDHYHAVVLDVHGTLNNFTQLLNWMLTKATQALRGWQGAVFDRQGPSPMEILTSAALLKRIGYVAANPVAAGLVAHGDLWPGVRSSVHDIGGAPRSITRPNIFFAVDGTAPESVELRFELPPALVEEHGIDGAKAAIASAIEGAEDSARKHWEKERRPFKGVRAVRKTSPYDRATTYEQRHRLRPRYACGGDREALLAAIARRREFVRLYADARERWLRGERDVVWPAGTWAMRRFHNVRCAEAG